MPRLAPALAFAATIALPAQALDLDTMSEAERASFRAEIRAYLLENPEVIMEAVAVLEARDQQAQAQADVALVKANEEALLDDGFSWVGGNPDGDITLVEFLDYRCGFCRRAHPEVEGLLAADGNIRLIVKEFPILGEDSLTSSRFAIAVKQVAGDEAYKAAHDALISYSGEVSEPALRRISDGLGLPTDDVMDQMDSAEVSQVIEANHALGRALQISGTPSFVFGDQMLRGFVPQNEMAQLAAEIRAQ